MTIVVEEERFELADRETQRCLPPCIDSFRCRDQVSIRADLRPDVRSTVVDVVMCSAVPREHEQ